MLSDTRVAPRSSRRPTGGPLAQPRLSPSREQATWDAVARVWGGTEIDRLWREHSDAVNARLLDRWLPPSLGRVLKTDLFDEAVSPGLYAMLAERAAEVTGIDLAGGIAAAARARHASLRVATADVRMLPFGDGAFDAIVSLSTLDHFHAAADLRASLVELCRVLRPGGTLVLTLDNVANPLVALRNALPFTLTHRLGLVPYYVGHSCGPRAAAALLARCGFRVEECTTTLHVPRVVAVPVTRLLRGRGGPRGQRALARAMLAWERLARWPTRATTGHFVAIRATRPSGP